MICGKLSDAMRYASLGENFRRAFAFLTTQPLSALTERLELDGKNLYVLPQQPVLKTREAARWEAHRLYADIQVVLEGEEIMAWAPLSAMTGETVPYNPEKDVVFFAGEGTETVYHPGEFAVFFPEDVHKPCVRPDGGNETVKKLVVKVRL